MSAPRWFGPFAIIFAAAYAILYGLSVHLNWALFTYHPALDSFGFLRTPAKAGPSMFWYGWMATSALGAGALAALVCLLPERLTRRLWPCLAWAVPVCVIVVFAVLLRGYFLR